MENALEEQQEQLKQDGYRGLNIRLPAVACFVSDVTSKSELHPLTQALSGALYHRNEPKKVI